MMALAVKPADLEPMVRAALRTETGPAGEVANLSLERRRKFAAVVRRYRFLYEELAMTGVMHADLIACIYFTARRRSVRAP